MSSIRLGNVTTESVNQGNKSYYGGDDWDDVYNKRHWMQTIDENHEESARDIALDHYNYVPQLSIFEAKYSLHNYHLPFIIDGKKAKCSHTFHTDDGLDDNFKVSLKIHLTKSLGEIIPLNPQMYNSTPEPEPVPTPVIRFVEDVIMPVIVGGGVSMINEAPFMTKIGGNNVVTRYIRSIDTPATSNITYKLEYDTTTNSYIVDSSLIVSKIADQSLQYNESTVKWDYLITSIERLNALVKKYSTQGSLFDEIGYTVKGLKAMVFKIKTKVYKVYPYYEKGAENAYNSYGQTYAGVLYSMFSVWRKSVWTNLIRLADPNFKINEKRIEYSIDLLQRMIKILMALNYTREESFQLSLWWVHIYPAPFTLGHIVFYEVLKNMVAKDTFLEYRGAVFKTIGGTFNDIAFYTTKGLRALTLLRHYLKEGNPNIRLKGIENSTPEEKALMSAIVSHLTIPRMAVLTQDGDYRMRLFKRTKISKPILPDDFVLLEIPSRLLKTSYAGRSTIGSKAKEAELIAAEKRAIEAGKYKDVILDYSDVARSIRRCLSTCVVLNGFGEYSFRGDELGSLYDHTDGAHLDAMTYNIKLQSVDEDEKSLMLLYTTSFGMPTDFGKTLNYVPGFAYGKTTIKFDLDFSHLKCPGYEFKNVYGNRLHLTHSNIVSNVDLGQHEQILRVPTIKHINFDGLHPRQTMLRFNLGSGYLSQFSIADLGERENFTNVLNAYEVDVKIRPDRAEKDMYRLISVKGPQYINLDEIPLSGRITNGIVLHYNAVSTPKPPTTEQVSFITIVEYVITHEMDGMYIKNVLHV